MDMALDELIGTLEGPEFNAPESPAYTGPEVTVMPFFSPFIWSASITRLYLQD